VYHEKFDSTNSGQHVVNHSWNLGLLYEESEPAHAVELMMVAVEYLEMLPPPLTPPPHGRGE